MQIMIFIVTEVQNYIFYVTLISGAFACHVSVI